MSNLAAFNPIQNTQSLTVSTSSTTAFQLLAGSQVLVVNAGPNAAFVAFAPVSSGTVTAVIPTAGNPPGTTQSGVWVLNGTSQTFTVPSQAWVAAICAATQSATLHFCSGEGI